MIDMSSFYGKTQKTVTPINKPRVLKPNFEKVNFLEVDSSTECHVTPSDIAGEMVDYLNLESHHTVCEPQFGSGKLIDALLEYGHDEGLITGIERSQELFNHYNKDVELIRADFLEYQEKRFSRILMNPPFSRGLALKHIKHAFSLLEDDGLIIALVPCTFKHGYTIRSLDENTFTSTKAITKIISLDHNNFSL